MGSVADGAGVELDLTGTGFDFLTVDLVVSSGVLAFAGAGGSGLGEAGTRVVSVFRLRALLKNGLFRFEGSVSATSSTFSFGTIHQNPGILSNLNGLTRFSSICPTFER